MSNKPTLNKLTQISNKEESAVALLNENFEKIEKAIEDSVSRSGVVPTAMLADLDMGSKSLINLGAPKGDNDAVRYVDVRNALGNTKEYSEKASAAASRAEDSAASANTSAVAARFSSESASASAEDCNEALEVVTALKEELITNPSVKTVADNIADVNIVAGRIDDVTSVAENVDTVVDAKNKVIDLSTRILFGNLGDVQATASLVAPRGCEFLDGHVITKETYPQAFSALEAGILPSRSKAEYKAAAGTVSGLDFSSIDASNFGGRLTIRSNNTKADIMFNLEQGFHGYVDLGIKVPNDTTHYELAIGGMDFNKQIARGLLAETPLGTVFYEDGVIKYFPKFMLPNGSQMQESAWTTVEPTWASSGGAYLSFKIVWDSNELPYMEVYSNHTPSEASYVGTCRWNEETYGSFETNHGFPWKDMKVFPNEAVIIGAYGDFTTPAMYSYYGHRVWVNGEVAYQELFVPENSYPFFGYDAGSSTAYLPIAWDIFIEASNTHAGIVEAGLPNITGEAGNYGNGNGSHKYNSGAMYVRDYTDVTGESEDTQGNSLIYGIDASLSNAIYGKSDTVQPNALRFRYYIVLAEGATMVYTNRPSVATYKDLPRTGNTMGDVRGARDTNISYVWAKQADGSFAWSSLGMSIGITEQRLQEVVGDVSDILADV